MCIEHCVSHGLVESVHSMCQRMRPPARILRTILTLVLHIGVPKGPLPISDTLPLFYDLLQNADITPEAAKTLYDMTLAERRLQKIIGVSVEDMRGTKQTLVRFGLDNVGRFRHKLPRRAASAFFSTGTNGSALHRRGLNHQQRGYHPSVH